MKKFYCYHCQNEVKPRGFWPFRFCPDCRRRITDKGEGFYRVCDICGANLPAKAEECMRCGYNFKTENAVKDFEFNAFLWRNSWFSWILVFLALIIGIIITLGVLYISFYFAAAFLLVALLVVLFNFLRAGLHI